MNTNVSTPDDGAFVLEARNSSLSPANGERNKPAKRSGSQLWRVMRQAVHGNKDSHIVKNPTNTWSLLRAKRGIQRLLGLEMSDYENQHWKYVQSCMMEGHQQQLHQLNGGGRAGINHIPHASTIKQDWWKLVYLSLKKKEKYIEKQQGIPKAAEHDLGLDVPDGLVEDYKYVKESWLKQQSIEGLLHLRYKYVNLEKHRYLHEIGKQRPYFTYWLMFVHIIIMIVTLSVYGFAPYQWDVTTTSAFVQTSSLTLEAAKKNVTGSVWGGPDLGSLVLLGAKYAPCMRRDRQLYTAIEADWANEAANSGCCVRRDKSGCVQVLSASDCPVTYADFYYQYNDTESTTPVRAVCGTSPYTCINPNRFQNPAWNTNISNWPICLQAANSTYPHLSCELTGRPCCVGLQAACLITTLEHCNFLGGRYHSDAFLCSQVDCLSGVCGLIPFAVKNHPDQVYRLWLSLFLHAGILHIVLSLLFSFFVLRVIEKRLGWLKTCLVYILSGVGGNIVSAVFVPYYPEVGPGSSVFGIIAYIFVFLLMEYPYLEMPWVVLMTMSTILGLSLVMGVLLPFLDNFTHIGGFIFGFFIGWIVVQYKQLNDDNLVLLQTAANQSLKDDSIDILRKKQHKSLTLKYVMMGISSVASLILFVVCLLWLYVGQDTWYDFTYLNCIPYTATFCLDYGQSLESRNYLD